MQDRVSPAGIQEDFPATKKSRNGCLGRGRSFEFYNYVRIKFSGHKHVDASFLESRDSVALISRIHDLKSILNSMHSSGLFRRVLKEYQFFIPFLRYRFKFSFFP